MIFVHPYTYIHIHIYVNIDLYSICIIYLVLLRLKDALSVVKTGATANTTEGNTRASRESGVLCSHSHGESVLCSHSHGESFAPQLRVLRAECDNLLRGLSHDMCTYVGLVVLVVCLCG